VLRVQEDYNNVKAIGANHSTARTPQQTTIGIWWAYDGAYKIGTAIRLGSQARLLALASACGAVARCVRLLLCQAVKTTRTDQVEHNMHATLRTTADCKVTWPTESAFAISGLALLVLQSCQPILLGIHADHRCHH
jgi:hypothetical protein